MVAKRGPEQATAIDKLTRATGRTIIAAAAPNQPALEGYRGHGFFTYIFLDALGRSDTDGNTLIELTELARFVGDRLP